MGLQCAKLIWFRYNAKDQIPAPIEATQAIFDQGTEVGELARQLFPGGTKVAPVFLLPIKSLPRRGRQSESVGHYTKRRLYSMAAMPGPTSWFPFLVMLGIWSR